MLRWPSTILSLLGVLAATATGQTVQLPTFQQFSASTTIVVPDRGSAWLGGMHRSASGSNQFGSLPGNRSTGSADSASGLRVFVQIHDFETMDRALLNEARAGRVSGRPVVKGARGPSESPAREENLLSTAEIRRRKASTKPTASEAPHLMERAAQAEASGNLGAARVYLQMAARQSTGLLHERALEHYRRLKPAIRSTKPVEDLSVEEPLAGFPEK
jgi:hypothetical protein